MSRTWNVPSHKTRNMRHNRHGNSICVSPCNYCNPRSPGKRSRKVKVLKFDA